MNNDLMQKLAISKKIMDASENIKPGQAQTQMPMANNVNATYNIPQEMLSENQAQQPAPVSQSAPGTPTPDRIQNSNLPDEIKQLMMEHPIQQPNFGGGGPVLSDDVIEGATRLMGNNSQPQVNESPVSNPTPNINNDNLKQMIRDVVRDTVRDVVREELQSSGLLTEEGSKANETLSLRVGKHVFEGKVTKIKKVK